jgi:hypothetical protein
LIGNSDFSGVFFKFRSLVQLFSRLGSGRGIRAAGDTEEEQITGISTKIPGKYIKLPVF